MRKWTVDEDFNDIANNAFSEVERSMCTFMWGVKEIESHINDTEKSGIYGDYIEEFSEVASRLEDLLKRWRQASKFYDEIETETEIEQCELEKEWNEYTILVDDENYASEDDFVRDERHRNHRFAKANYKANRNRCETRSKFLPQKAKANGKKWLHKYNRRNWNENGNYYKHHAYSYESMVWDMT